jgi:cathepsin L
VSRSPWRAVHVLLLSLANGCVSGDGIDWRTKGAVNKIKDQGQCGSCWAFSAVSTAESAWEIAGNKLESLSESQVVDCDNQNAGCNGGDPSSALDYIIKTGIESEKDYPYKDYDRSCAFNKNKVTDVRIKDYIKVSSGSEDDLGTKLEQCGPVSVCIDADHDGFMSYSHGIYKEDNCGTSMYDLDHAIVAVGYTDEAWIVRNSWGTSWGEQGYVNMARNYGKGNMCGIATEAVCAVA